MKLLAIIMCFWMLGLIFQPVAVRVGVSGPTRCEAQCAGKDECQGGAEDADNGICDSGFCNPLLSICPYYVCTIVEPVTFDVRKSFETGQRHECKPTVMLYSTYETCILKPPIGDMLIAA